MKRIVFSLIILSFLVSCGTTTQTVNNKIAQLSLGMSKKEVIDMLGSDFTILQGVATPDGDLETVHYYFRMFFDFDQSYFITFLDGRLVEYVRESPSRPYSNERTLVANRTIHGDVRINDGSGVSTTIRRNVFDDVVMEDNNGNRVIIKRDSSGEPLVVDKDGNQTRLSKDIFGDYRGGRGDNAIQVKRDIFGDLKFSGAGEKEAKIKKDIFETRTYSDSRGNKVEYKKDAWEAAVGEYGEDQLLFISLIKKYLY